MTNTLMIKPEEVKRLREQTGAGIMDCKRALEESGGDMEKAVLWLREKGLSTAAKKAGRAAREGIVTSYIHMALAWGLVESNARPTCGAHEDFQQLARDIAMQIGGWRRCRQPLTTCPPRRSRCRSACHDDAERDVRPGRRSR